MAGQVPNKVINNIVTLLLAKDPDEIPMKNFVSDYANHTGYPLRYDDFGFSTLCEFITAIPDVARIKKSELNPDCMVVAMASAITRSKFSNNAPKSQTFFDPEVEELEADGYGRYSLCYPRDKADGRSKEEIIEEFSPGGDVIDVHLSDSCKEELQSCMNRYRSQYNLCIGRSNRSNEGSSQKRNENDGPSKNKRQFQRGSNGGDYRGKTDNDDHFKNSAKGHNGRGEVYNGISPKNRDSHSSGDTWKDSESDSCSTELYVGNIESEEELKRAVQTYRMKSMQFFERGVKKFAFLSMWNHEDALAIIRDLNQKMQQTRKLLVQFNTSEGKKNQHNISDNSSSCSDHSGTRRPGPSYGLKSHIKENGGGYPGMPPLEPDVSDIPPLNKDSDVYDPDGRYDFDCGVLVTQFPAQTLESELRKVFEGYRVLDICVLNNGFQDGCTRAMLYMSTLYEAVRAVKEGNGLVLRNHHLKVIPPPDNILLRKILLRMETGLREY